MSIIQDQFIAANLGDIDDLRRSIPEPILKYNLNGLTALHVVALNGHLNCLQYLIEECGCDINTLSKANWTPLQAAIHAVSTEKNALSCVDYLLEMGADISIPSDDGCTALHRAVLCKDQDMVQKLVDLGADICFKDKNGFTPLDLARIWGNRPCTRILQIQEWFRNKEFIAKQMNQLKLLRYQKTNKPADDTEICGWDKLTIDSEGNTEGRQQNEINKKKDLGQINKIGISKKNDRGKKNGGCQKNDEGKKNDGCQKNDEGKKNDGCQKNEGQKNDGCQKNEGQKNDESQKSDIGEGDCVKEKKNSKTIVLKAGSTNLGRNKKSYKRILDKYVPNLGDEYPRDYYTLMPKHNNCTKYYDGKHRNLSDIPQYLMHQVNKKVSLPDLPESVLLKQLSKDPSLFERPVVFNSKHVDNIPRKLRSCETTYTKSEIGLHLTNDTSSYSFLNALHANTRTQCNDSIAKPARNMSRKLENTSCPVWT